MKNPPEPHPLAAVSSPDHNAERIAALKQLFPDLFSNDGRLNVDELKKVVDPGSSARPSVTISDGMGKPSPSNRQFILVQLPEPETVDWFKTHKDKFFICLELALDTTKKWNLKHNLGEKSKAI